MGGGGGGGGGAGGEGGGPGGGGGEYDFKCLLSGSEADNTTAPFAGGHYCFICLAGNNTPGQIWASYIQLGMDEPFSSNTPKNNLLHTTTSYQTILI